MNLQPGELIDGKYRIVKLIGQGGMGAVYEGNHELIDRRVAIKVLLPTAEQEHAVARFEREARAAGRIGNDHILEVLDIGSIGDGSRYMVMEFLDGDPLSKRIEQRLRLTGAEVAKIAIQLLDGLGAAHSAGVLHRDLKPDNIFLVRQKAGHRDFVKIIDFGISKFQPLGQSEEMRMTATGMVVGTPYYISPEQAKGLGDVDLRSDLYAVGVILYEALSGRVPFLADNFNNLLFKIVLEEPPQLATLVPDVDPELAAIVHRAMARERSARYASADEFSAAIVDWVNRSGISLDMVADPGRPSIVSPGGMSTPSGGVSTQSGAMSTQSGAVSAQSSPAMRTAVGNTVGSMTPGAFGASQPLPPVEVPKKKAPVALLAAGAVGLIAVVGTVAAITSNSAEPEAVQSAAQVAVTQPATPPTPEPATAPAPTPETPTEAPSPAPAPPPEPAPAASASADAKPASSHTETSRSAQRASRTPRVSPTPPAQPTQTAPTQPPPSNKRRNFGY
jgi:serine/threonine-protein kinase